MKKTLIIISLLLCFCMLTAVSVGAITPTLRYSNAGTLELWTEESYYNGPIVDDLDNDGALEIIFSNYSITVLNAADGQVEWKVNSGHDRNTPFAEFGMSVGYTWCDAVVTDLEGDGLKEVITVHGNGTISVLDHNGYFKPGWPQCPGPYAGRSLEAADLDLDGRKEIIVGYGLEGPNSVYVYNCTGTLLPGWPQLNAANHGIVGFSAGIYTDTISVSDLDGDGDKEIIAPTDVSHISAFHHDGTPVLANPDVYGGRYWGQIALYEDYNSEIRGENGGWGWDVNGTEKREELYKGEFGHGVSRPIDLDGNGTEEIVVSTIMCNRKYAPVYPPSEYMTICILNNDRTRYNNPALDADWTVLPTDLGKPLVQNAISLPSHVFQVPVISDLDGDGKYEILFNSYNGKVHCFTMDKREPYAWPYSLTKRTSPLYEYATPVVCRDLDFDGKQEIIFASFYDETQALPGIVQGSLYILNYEGKLISKTTLPPAKEAYNKNNGARSAPAVTDIDGDGRYEIIINTLHGAICVYDV